MKLSNNITNMYDASMTCWSALSSLKLGHRKVTRGARIAKTKLPTATCTAPQKTSRYESAFPAQTNTVAIYNTIHHSKGLKFHFSFSTSPLNYLETTLPHIQVRLYTSRQQ